MTQFLVDTISVVKKHEVEHDIKHAFKQTLSDWEYTLATSKISKPNRNLFINNNKNGSTANIDSIKIAVDAKLQPELWFEVPFDVELLNKLPVRFFDNIVIHGVINSDNNISDIFKTAINLIITTIHKLLRKTHTSENTGSLVMVTLNDNTDSNAVAESSTNTIEKYLRSKECMTLVDRIKLNLDDSFELKTHLNTVFNEYGFSVVSTGDELFAFGLELISPVTSEWPEPRTLPTFLIKKLNKEYDRLTKIIDSTLYGDKSETINSPLEITKILKNHRNSCYIDSILFPLLVNPKWYISKKLLHSDLTNIDKKACDTTLQSINVATSVKRELQRLMRIIRSKKPYNTEELTCINLRKILKKCKFLKKFASREQMDDSEFLIAIISLFDIGLTTVETTITYYTDENEIKNPPLQLEKTVIQRKEITLEINFADIDNSIPIQDIIEHYQQEEIAIADDILFGDNRNKRYKIQHYTILDSECLIFRINRLVNTPDGERIYIDNKVALVPYIYKGNAEYKLSLITVHSGGIGGGHYISYFKTNDVWFTYDDTDDDTPFRTSWSEITDVASQQCSILLYEKMPNKGNTDI